jgi:hypothetical protein
VACARGRDGTPRAAAACVVWHAGMHGRRCAFTTCAATVLLSPRARPPLCFHRPHGRRCAFTTRMAAAVLSPPAWPPLCFHRPHGRRCAFTTRMAAAVLSPPAWPPLCFHRPHGRRVAFTACMAITVHINRQARRLLVAGATAHARHASLASLLCATRSTDSSRCMGTGARYQRMATALYASRAVRRLPHLVCAGRQRRIPWFGSPCVAGECGRALGVSESLVPRAEGMRPQCTRTVCAHAAWRHAACPHSAPASGTCPSSDTAELHSSAPCHLPRTSVAAHACSGSCTRRVACRRARRAPRGRPAHRHALRGSCLSVARGEAVGPSQPAAAARNLPAAHGQRGQVRRSPPTPLTAQSRLPAHLTAQSRPLTSSSVHPTAPPFPPMHSCSPC